MLILRDTVVSKLQMVEIYKCNISLVPGMCLI